jgi:dolichol-phosphate mannosyltransferase
MNAVSVILPTLDEADNLRVLLPELLALPPVHAVLVVDDGSTDGTRELVSAYGDARVELIARTAPRSLAGSLQDGIDRATTPLVAWMDADGTMQPKDLLRLCDALRDDVAMAVGSRFVEGGALKGQTRPGLLGALSSVLSMRHTADGAVGALLSLVLNAALLPPLLGRWGAHDWTSGFVVARRDRVAPLRLRGTHGEYFFDLWIRLERQGDRVVEVPVQMRPRAHGRSKTGTQLVHFLRRGARYLTRAMALRREDQTDAS